jgi:hypothetical protein
VEGFSLWHTYSFQILCNLFSIAFCADHIKLKVPVCQKKTKSYLEDLSMLPCSLQCYAQTLRYGINLGVQQMMNRFLKCGIVVIGYYSS